MNDIIQPTGRSSGKDPTRCPYVPHIPVPGSVTASPHSRSHWKRDVSPSEYLPVLYPLIMNLQHHRPLIWQHSNSRAGGAAGYPQTHRKRSAKAGVFICCCDRFPHFLCPWDARCVTIALPTFSKRDRRTGYRCSLSAAPNVDVKGGPRNIFQVRNRDVAATEDAEVNPPVAYLWKCGGYSRLKIHVQHFFICQNIH